MGHVNGYEKILFLGKILDMLIRLLILLSINILIGEAYIAQKEFCKSAVVVRAKILPKGSLYGKIRKPAVHKFYRLFEIKILEVFKDDLSF